MTVPFVLPYIYACEGIPPRKRTPRKFYARSAATFTIPEAQGYELEPALLFRRHEEHEGKTYRNEIEIKQCRGMLVRPLPAGERIYDDTPLGVDGLASLATRRLNLMPKALQADSASYAYQYPGDVEDASSLNPAKIERDASREAQAEIQRKIDRTLVIVDGIVHARAPDPCWNVHIWGRNGWTGQALLVPDRTFAFPGDSRDLLDDFSDWCSRRFAQGIEIDARTSIEALATDIPFGSNPIVRAAERFADRAELNITNHDSFGTDVKKLGQAFLAEKSVSAAVAFMSAFEEAAKSPEARPILGGIENPGWFEMFWKFYELMPAGYKLDGAEDSLDLPLEIGQPTPGF